MRTGRPKDIMKRENRKKTTRLSERAHITLEKIKQERHNFDFSRYVSERIIQDFEESPLEYYKLIVAENNKQIDALTRKNKEIMEIMIKEREKENTIKVE